jgi:hypothetical protein
MSEIVKALTAIMAEVGSVKKGGRNTFHGYDYARAEDVAHALQQVMAKHGVMVIQTENGQSVGVVGERGSVVKQSYRFFLLHTSGEKLTEIDGVPFTHTGVAQAMNSKGGLDDKAINKCHTAARKYFLLALFQIPTGEFADADGDEEQPAPDRAVRARHPGQGDERSREAGGDRAAGRTEPPPDPTPPTDRRNEPADTLKVRWQPDSTGYAMVREFSRGIKGGTMALNALRGATAANRATMDIPENQQLLDMLEGVAKENPAAEPWFAVIAEIRDLHANPPGPQ